jgi:flavin-dependent dehydrogenase
MTSDHFNTIIIGAGPGGLSAAKVLAENGRKVLVCERNTRIGTKVCAGGITLTGQNQAVPRHLIEQEFPHQHVSSGWQQTIIRNRKPIVSTINREALGGWMAKQARDAGAVIKTGCRVRSIHGKTVQTDAGTYQFDTLIGADGATSLVRRYLNLPTELIGTGIHYHIPGVLPEMVWHLDATVFNTGYAWIFPQANRTSVGAYSFRADMGPKVLKEKLHQWMDGRGINYASLSPKAGNISFDYRGYQFDNIYLVGEAAGLASGLTGEGILPAIISGEEIANIILNPSHTPTKLTRLIKNHSRHTKILLLSGKSNFHCRVIMESLVLALRLKLIPFSALEMGN